jgi:hypothetical protein
MHDGRRWFVVGDGADDEGRGMKRHTGRQIQQGLVDDERRGKTVQNRVTVCAMCLTGTTS